jgi:hypothetical protein
MGPFISDIEAGPNGLFPPGSAFWSVSGTGCTQFAPGPPEIGHVGHAQIGTSNFSATLSNTGPSLPAVLAYGLSDTFWLGIALPFDLGLVGFSGCTLYQNLVGQIPAFTDGTGSAVQVLPVPNDPNLLGIPVYLQWVVANVVAGGIALTPLGTVIIEQ